MKYSQGKDKKAIAVCMAKFNGIDQVEFIRSFHEACKKRNYRIFIFSSSIDFLTDINVSAEQKIYDLLEPKNYDAVVIMYDTFKIPGMAESIARKTVDSGTLCFSLNAEMEGCITIKYGFKSGFEKVVRHIVEHHKAKNINFIAGNKGNPFSEDRLAVFRKVCKENNVPVEEDRIGYGDFWERPTDEVMDNFLSSGKKFDAIICANDFMAMEACKKLRKAGYKVPEDVLVSGFDGAELERYHYPRLATAYYDIDDAAEKIGEVVEDYALGVKPNSEYTIDVKFRAGQSCGCHDPNSLAGGVEAFGVSSFETHMHIRELEASMELLYEKVSQTGAYEKLNEVWGEMFYLEGRFFDADFDLLINDDFLKEDLELWPSLRPSDRSEVHNYYTDEMRIAMNIRDGVFTNHLDFHRAELIPGFNEQYEKDGCTIFLPVHVHGSTVGYCDCTFDPAKIDFFLLLSYVNNICQLLESHKARLDQQNLYSTDQLTKLLNRKGFYRHMEEQMEAAVLSQKPVCVISIDMNGLKYINDTFGHKEGDFALAKVGEILESVVGDLGVCTRFGGDEFAVAFTGDEAEARCSLVVGEIRERLKAFNDTGKKPYPLSVSLGSSCHVPESVEYLERFLMEADKKMYKNKQIIKAREASQHE